MLPTCKTRSCRFLQPRNIQRLRSRKSNQKTLKLQKHQLLWSEDIEISWPEWREYLGKPVHHLHTLMNPQTVPHAGFTLLLSRDMASISSWQKQAVPQYPPAMVSATQEIAEPPSHGNTNNSGEGRPSGLVCTPVFPTYDIGRSWVAHLKPIDPEREWMQCTRQSWFVVIYPMLVTVWTLGNWDWALPEHENTEFWCRRQGSWTCIWSSTPWCQWGQGMQWGAEDPLPEGKELHSVLCIPPWGWQGPAKSLSHNPPPDGSWEVAITAPPSPAESKQQNAKHFHLSHLEADTNTLHLLLHLSKRIICLKKNNWGPSISLYNNHNIQGPIKNMICQEPLK